MGDRLAGAIAATDASRAHVAVKLLNLAVFDRLGEGRFRREGTLLARLSHPHIARLLDAGVTAAGQPFLVLEYVERHAPRSLRGGTALGVERGSSCSCRSPTPSRTPTPTWSCIAT